MHIRPKPWARPELLACGFFIPEATELRGHWQDAFERRAPLHLELGCGKGTFIAALGRRHPEVNYLAVDMIDAVLGLSKRNVEQAYAPGAVDNVRLTAWDIARIGEMLSPEDAVERIYINFCNPWPKRRYQKKRLTHSRQLEQYKKIMVPGAQIHFKTDDDPLSEASLQYFEYSGFRVTTLIRDLHASDEYPGNIVTEHERMFADQGIKIKLAIAEINGE